MPGNGDGMLGLLNCPYCRYACVRSSTTSFPSAPLCQPCMYRVDIRGRYTYSVVCLILDAVRGLHRLSAASCDLHGTCSAEIRDKELQREESVVAGIVKQPGKFLRGRKP